MENVVFYAKMLKGRDAIVGKAVVFEQISNDKKLTEINLIKAYFPLSQLQVDVIKKDYNKDYALVECRVPVWLWDAKVEAERGFQSKLSASFTQLTMLTADDNPTLEAEAEKVRDVVNEGLE